MMRIAKAALTCAFIGLATIAVVVMLWHQSAYACANDADPDCPPMGMKVAVPAQPPATPPATAPAPDTGAGGAAPIPECNTPACSKLCSGDQASPTCDANNRCVCAKY